MITRPNTFAMRFVKFLIFTALTVGLVWALNQSWSIDKDTQTPRLGYFLSPATGFWQNAEGESPQLSAHLRNKTLSAPVQVAYDDRMVPHIYAENMKDALFAQGYATAALRLWQMEFQTHAAAGRICEIVGEKALPLDLKSRRIGMLHSAKKAAKAWEQRPEIWDLLESYSAGVNAYIESLDEGDYPIEYKLLNYAPEAWTPLKCALLLKYMSRDLTGSDDDIELTNALQILGKDRFEALYPEYFKQQSPIVRDSTWRFTPQMVKLAQDSVLPDIKTPLPYPVTEKSDPNLGSNNWALAGSKTQSGSPILCNDPHLTFNLPSIWFEVQITTPDFSAYGASLPGAPGVISGFNKNIAWGITNVAHDVHDWFQISWKDASKSAYLYEGDTKEVERIVEEIKIRGAATLYDTVLYTHHGPVVYSSDDDAHKDMALRWTAHDVSYEVLTFLGLMQADNYEQYVEALSHFSCPAQNFVFACKDGDIGIWAQGKLPLKRQQQGRFVLDGSKKAQEWQGYIPQVHIPHEHNPQRGFVGSANQHSTAPDYPYYYNGRFEEYRGRYLNEALAKLENATAEDMKALQLDNTNQRARDFLPLFLAQLHRHTLKRDALELLAQVEKWDYKNEADSKAATIFNTWFIAFKKLAYDEIDYFKEKAKVELVYPYEWQLLNALEQDSLHFIFDHFETATKRESSKDIVTRALNDAVNEVPRDSSNAVLPWWQAKSTDIKHLARLAPFSIMDLKTGGNKNALNAMNDKSGPSWRMIVELGDIVKAHVVYPGGQSGNPGSRFYTSMVQDWSNGKYYSAHFWPEYKAGSADYLIQQELHP